METNATNTLTINDVTNQLYERVSKYYELQIQSIGPDEYAYIQQTINYPETYEEHIQNLKDTIKSKEQTLSHINEFITKYPEFLSPQYVLILDYVIEILLTDPDKAKQAGMQALLNVQKEINNTDDVDDDNAIQEHSNSDMPTTIPYQVGAQIIELPTYQDPLLVSLYSVCMMAFGIRISNNNSTGSCRQNAF